MFVYLFFVNGILSSNFLDAKNTIKVYLGLGSNAIEVKGGRNFEQRIMSSTTLTDGCDFQFVSMSNEKIILKQWNSFWRSNDYPEGIRAVVLDDPFPNINCESDFREILDAVSMYEPVTKPAFEHRYYSIFNFSEICNFELKIRNIKISFERQNRHNAARKVKYMMYMVESGGYKHYLRQQNYDSRFDPIWQIMPYLPIFVSAAVLNKLFFLMIRFVAVHLYEIAGSILNEEIIFQNENNIVRSVAFLAAGGWFAEVKINLHNAKCRFERRVENLSRTK